MPAFCTCQGAPPNRWVKAPGTERFVCAGCGLRSRKNYTDEGPEAMTEIDPTELPHHNHSFTPVEGGSVCACGAKIDRTQRPPVLTQGVPPVPKPDPHAFVKSAEGSGKVCMLDGCGAGPRAKIHKVAAPPAEPVSTLPDEEEARLGALLEPVGWAPSESLIETLASSSTVPPPEVSENGPCVCGGPSREDPWTSCHNECGSRETLSRTEPTYEDYGAAKRAECDPEVSCCSDGPCPTHAADVPAWEEIPAPVVVSISGHTRESTPSGPDYCRECSRHIHDWVTWPCTGQLPEQCAHQMRPEACEDCTPAPECLHGLRGGCSLCAGIPDHEVMAVTLGTPLPSEPIPMTWTAGCSCDLETMELMGCVCGGVGSEPAAPPPPSPYLALVQSEVAAVGTVLDMMPAGAVTEVLASGSVVSPALEATTAPAAEETPTVEHESTADAAVRGPRRVFSNSELRTFKRCRRKWWLTYYRKLTLRREGVGPLSIGNMVHWPLEVYYGTPDRDPETFDWETPLAAHVEARLADPNLPDHLHSKMLEDYELVKIMLRGYFEWLCEDGADSELNILAPEREIEAFIDHIDGMEVWLIGKLDVEAELRSDGRRVFVDHKSVANLADLPKTGQIDEQIPTYGLLQRLEAAALRDAGLPHAESFARGGIWNMIRKVKRTASAKPPFYGRAGVSHNDEVYRNFYKRVWGEARDILATTRNLDAGGDPLVEVYPMPTRDCAWDCPFFTICPMFDDGSDVESVIGMEYETHDPYARYTELEKG